MTQGYPIRQMRRLRYNPALRAALSSVRLAKRELIAPIFASQAISQRREISTMPGQFQRSVADAADYAESLADKGVGGVLIFGIPSAKDAIGSGAWDEQGPTQQAVREIKKRRPELLVITDTCLCEYTEQGHCGPVVESRGRVDVDNSGALVGLAKAAVSQAQAGADVIAPSACMDGQVRAIRTALDNAGFERIPILSYAVKFASSLYGPFREAAESAPKMGDRRSYQMDPLSPKQVMAEALADLEEGADMLMVKPALAYLDIIAQLASLPVPLAAYHVSGEYAMIKFAAAAGAIHERDVVMETTAALKRAGADLIITYFAEQLTQWL